MLGKRSLFTPLSFGLIMVALGTGLPNDIGLYGDGGIGGRYEECVDSGADSYLL